jgi:hypothetical protein
MRINAFSEVNGEVDFLGTSRRQVVVDGMSEWEFEQWAEEGG